MKRLLLVLALGWVALARGAVLTEADKPLETEVGAAPGEAGGFLGMPNVDTNSELALLLMKAVRSAPRAERLRDAERVLALDPDDPDAQQNLARLYLADNRLDQAAVLFWKVARAAPADRARLEEFGFSLLATGDQANGFKVYDYLHRAGYQTPAVTFNYAAACHHTGRSREAIQLMQTFLAGQPNHFRALYNLGVMYHRAGQPKEAAVMLERALKQQPGQAFVLAVQARLLKESGQTAAFEKTRQLLVKSVGAASAQALLDSPDLPVYLIR